MKTGKTLRLKYEEGCRQYSYECDVSTRNYIQLFQSQLVNKSLTLQMKQAVALSDTGYYTQLCLINNRSKAHGFAGMRNERLEL